MKRTARCLIVTLAAMLSGCGAQSLLLGTDGETLFIVSDALTVPGREVDLRARLLVGDLLEAKPGYVIRFHEPGGELYRVAETDADGVALAAYAPEAPGDYVFRIEVAPAGLDTPPPEPRDLLVACRERRTRMVIVDMDKTVVASGFDTVLVGDPEPMPNSADLLKELAQDHTIVYLTHRPEYFGPKSKAWLREQGYPRGPVILSSVSGFISGSGTFKTRQIAGMKELFPRIEIGIGDKLSDARAYYDNGLESFLILPIPEDGDAEEYEALAIEVSELPSEIHVVFDWREIEQTLKEGRAFPPSRMVQHLEELAQRKEAEE
jgi:hypothetical protein